MPASTHALLETREKNEYANCWEDRPIGARARQVNPPVKAIAKCHPLLPHLHAGQPLGCNSHGIHRLEAKFWEP